jgi:hypothetical protein
MFSVSIKKKTLKEVEKMPISVQESLTARLEGKWTSPVGMAELQQDWERNVSLSFIKEMGGVLVL